MVSFPLGKLVATPGALAVLKRCSQSPAEIVAKHARGEWDGLDAYGAEANRAAIRDGGRVFGSFTTRAGDTLGVITEADRASTCLLLPAEY
ncbi:MAG TPA: hypothetical protein VGE74_17580 [Gemmata sp.]